MPRYRITYLADNGEEPQTEDVEFDGMSNGEHGFEFWEDGAGTKLYVAKTVVARVEELA